MDPFNNSKNNGLKNFLVIATGFHEIKCFESKLLAVLLKMRNYYQISWNLLHSLRFGIQMVPSNKKLSRKMYTEAFKFRVDLMSNM